MNNFDDLIEEFVRSAAQNDVKMILVGGGAVNFHGYQRHSADIDFWIELNDENLERLKRALSSIGFEYKKTPQEVKQGLQNISVKISPFIEIEIITRFSLDKEFDEAYRNADIKEFNNLKLRVLSLDDLIDSKVNSTRKKDLLDIERLKEIHNID